MTGRRSRSNSRERAGSVIPPEDSAVSEDGLAAAAAAAELRAEEEIRDNLPREVLIIGRRLELHQADSTAAISSIHGELAKLSEMMSSLGTSFSRLTIPAELSAKPQSHPFSTPPLLPQHTLSPIIEQPTPTTTPAGHHPLPSHPISET